MAEQAVSSASSGDRRGRVRLAVGLSISAAFLFLALRNVHWAEVVKAWREARPLFLAAGVLVLIAGWAVAAVRWRALLAPAPGLRVRDTFAYICIGYLANTVLPLRLGELARATWIGRKKGLGVSRALGSIAVERVFDLLAVILVTLLLTLLVRIPPIVQAGLASMIGAALVAFVGLLALALNEQRLRRLTGLLARVMPRPVADRVAAMASGFASGAAATRRPATLAAVAGLSLGLWAIGGTATLLWVRAFNFDAPWFAGFLVLVVVNLGSAIPSSPGYVGVYHAAAILALSLWVPKEPALAYALVTHALNMLANVLLGSYFLVREGVGLKGLAGKSE